MIAPLAGFLASKWALPTLIGAGVGLQAWGAKQGANTTAAMLNMQTQQNENNIFAKNQIEQGNLGAMKEGMNFQRTSGPQQMKLAKGWNLFKEGELGEERAKTAANTYKRMTDAELSPESTALRRQKNWESLHNQLTLQADAANRKWGYVPSRNPFGLGGNI